MSTPRRSVPPDLVGFSYEQLLGQGGYADVFLYEQQMPRRRVAVKVLLPEAMSTTNTAQFAEEANTMAAVSDHPFIVTIYQAGVASDGRAYLVMEYYPNPNFSVRARSGAIPLAEVLRVGVQVASAVETAHRAGILHRDIKPANILTSALMRPGLTDFGISVQGDPTVMAEGLSIPWAPPEIVAGGATGDRRSDVYSLGATLHTLLAGRSPFEVPGGSNRAADLIGRIERAELWPTGRPDVPESLERLLRQSMAKDPAARPQTAAAFARSLQAVEQEFGPGFTALDILDENVMSSRPTSPVLDDPGATRLKGPMRIDAQAPVTPAVDDATSHRGAAALISGVPDRPTGAPLGEARRRIGMPVEPEVEKTFVRPPSAIAEGVATGAKPKRTALLVGSAAALAIAATGIAAAAMRSGGGVSAPSTVAAAPVQTLVKLVTVPPVSDLRVARDADAKLTVSWSAPAEPAGLQFRWRRKDGDAATRQTADVSVVVDGVAAGASVCVEVESIDTGGRLSDPVSACGS